MGGGWIGKRGECSTRATDSQRCKSSTSRTYLIYLLSILHRNHTWELHCYTADDEDDNEDGNNNDNDNDADEGTLEIFKYT